MERLPHESITVLLLLLRAASPRTALNGLSLTFLLPDAQQVGGGHGGDGNEFVAGPRGWRETHS